jgi:hypothetical protein
MTEEAMSIERGDLFFIAHSAAAFEFIPFHS